MSNADFQFEVMEANLHSLGSRLSDVPVTSVLLCRLLVSLGRDMAANFEQKIRPFGLNEADFRVLTTLFSQPEGVAHPSDLCVPTSQSPANMSRISDALVSRGLITRVLSVQDRRRMVLRITEQGEELVRRLLPKLFQSLRDMMKEFPEVEQREFISQLRRLAAILEQAEAPQTPEQSP
jgi:MarR family transcriptional repressor of emrRAB